MTKERIEELAKAPYLRNWERDECLNEIERLQKENERLQKEKALLEADSIRYHTLVNYGVDNWDGYSDAMSEAEEALK